MPAALYNGFGFKQKHYSFLPQEIVFQKLLINHNLAFFAIIISEVRLGF